MINISSKENSHQYDNKSTTIIIHDKDINTDNLHISVYKKRKDRSITNEPSDENRRKFSARHHKETKSTERIEDKVYSAESRGNSRKRRGRTKKHHTGSEILLKDNTTKMPKDRNVSVEISKNKSIAELYKAPNSKSISIKKKSIQYAMKRSRINDLLK